MSVSTNKKIELCEEVNCAIYFIEFGLIALNWIKNVEHLTILLLSNGFERLLKIILCLDYLEQNGQFPDSKSFRKHKNHDIEKLLKQVIDITKKWKYQEKCESTRVDMGFLENDCELKRLIKIMSDYGKGNRYYHTNILIGQKIIGSDPAQLFGSNHIGNTKFLQRFARALCRMFIWGELGQIGKDLSQIVGDFLDLQDETLEQVEFPWFRS